MEKRELVYIADLIRHFVSFEAAAVQRFSTDECLDPYTLVQAAVHFEDEIRRYLDKYPLNGDDVEVYFY